PGLVKDLPAASLDPYYGTHQKANDGRDFMTTKVAWTTLLLGSVLMAQQAPPGQQGRGGGQPQAQGPREVTITAIPGVIAADAKWKLVWEELGNNGDGIVAAQDGSLLIGQNDNSQVIRLDASDKATVLVKDTGSAGALAMDGKGRLFGV